MIKINTIINNKNWERYLVNPNKFVEKRIIKLNKEFKLYKKNKIYCTLLLSGDAEIKRLNKKFRKKNKTTDVLSFPFYEKSKLKNKFKNEKEVYLGDIIINLSKIKNKKNKKKFILEFNKLWIHGLVHLFGYNHIKIKEFKEMKKIEKKFLFYIN